LTLFTIGQEDKSYYEFCASGFKGHSEYTCNVGVDCSTQTFPKRLYRAPISSYMGDGVERIIISFTLGHDYNEVVLPLARAIRSWLNRLGVKTLFIERGSPWENGYIESFNGKLRDELLNREVFTTLTEAKVFIE